MLLVSETDKPVGKQDFPPPKKGLDPQYPPMTTARGRSRNFKRGKVSTKSVCVCVCVWGGGGGGGGANHLLEAFCIGNKLKGGGGGGGSAWICP